MKKFISILLCAVIVLGLCAELPLGSLRSQAADGSAAEFADDIGEMMRDGAEMSDIGEAGRLCGSDAVNSRLAVRATGEIDTLNAVSVAEDGGLWALQFPDTASAAKAYEFYSSCPLVRYVEYDCAVSAAENEGVSNSENGSVDGPDGRFLSWGVRGAGLDRLCDELSENAVSLKETVVAVIDSGVDYNHAFLAGRVQPTKINTSSGGKRNDCMDDSGHGTQVAGIIADSTPSSIVIRPYKVLDEYNRGTLISVAAGIKCAVKDGVDVINLSLGFYEDSKVLSEAIAYALENDIVIVGAAGNDATSEPYYPASYKEVLKITAVNQQYYAANFTNFGDDVDFAAPGVQIYTTTLGGEYTTVSGTSFAAPFASAEAALIRATLPKASAEDVFETMKKYAVLDHYQAFAPQKYGNGVLNAPSYNPENIFDEKTQQPYFSHSSELYTHEIELTISCDTPNSVIYYTLDGSIPSKSGETSIVYDGKPIAIASSAQIYAVAYSENSYRSKVASFSSVIAPVPPDSELSIDSDGNITAYSGSSRSITLPDTVGGVKVTGIADAAFGGSNINVIIAPDSVKRIGNGAFKNCYGLAFAIAAGATELGDEAFYGCNNLSRLSLGKLTSIGKYAFRGVASESYYYDDITFSLDLSALTEIPEGAFIDSAISAVSLGNVGSIGLKAFRDCNALVSVDIGCLGYMPAGSFKGCRSLGEVRIGGLTYLPNGSFSSCESLENVWLPDAEFIDSNAFENCGMLTGVNLPGAKTVYSNAFDGCISLRELELPAMTEFEPELYGSETKFPLFPRNLESFTAPLLKATVPDMFKASPRISRVMINGAEEIAPYTFRGCRNIYVLGISSVEKLGENALAECVIRFADAPNLVSAKNLPSNSGILLSNNFVEAYETAEQLTVYGTAGTFVERYANYKGYDFVPIPLIANEIPKYITEDSERVYISAIGFNLQYQWYWNTVNSAEGGTPIEGANESSYTFTPSDTAPFYYCVITQNDLGTVTRVTSEVMVKDSTPADYTEYNNAVKRAKAVNRSLYSNISVLDEAIAVDVSGKYFCEQELVDAQTAAILAAIEALEIKKAVIVTLNASQTDLKLLEKQKIVATVKPIDAIYDNLVWSSSNSNVLMVTSSGIVMCVGDGEAVVTATVINGDGTKVKNTITFDCELTAFEKFLAFFVRAYLAIARLFEKSLFLG